MIIAIESDQMFKDTIRGRTIVLFYAPWCPFCRRFLPVFERLAGAGARRAFTISVDDFPRHESSYGINIVPSVIVFDSGEPVLRLDGEPGQGLAEAQLAALLAKAALPE